MQRNEIIKPSIPKFLISKLPNMFRAYVWFFSYLIKNKGLIGNEVKTWSKSDADITFVSYLFNTEPIFSNSITFESPCWTKLPSMRMYERVRSKVIGFTSLLKMIKLKIQVLLRNQ